MKHSQAPVEAGHARAHVTQLLGNLLSRVLYAVKLVWGAAPWILVVMLLIAVFNGVLPVLGAFLSAELLNHISEAFFAAESGTPLPGAFRALLWLLGLQFGYLFARKLVNVVNRLVSRTSGELVVNHIRVLIMEKAKQVDLASFDSPAFYARLENANREAGTRPVQIITSTFSIFSELISMASFVVILWTVSPLVPLLMFAVSIPGAVVNYVFRHRYFRYMRKKSRDRRELNYYANLMVNKDLVKEIRMFDLSDTFLFRYKTVFHRYFGDMKHLFRREAFWNLILSLFSVLVTGGLFALMAYRATEGLSSIGDYSLYVGALNAIAAGVTTLISSSATIYEGTLFLDNLHDFLNEPITVVPRTDKPLLPARHVAHTIAFRNVSFRYPGTDRDVIKNLNLTIDAGSTVVLVGLNGAGKTTLLKLMTRLYDPTEGEILLDGVDLREYDVSALYAVFGMIFQDFGKYASSVSDNIAFGRSGATPDEAAIREAARFSGAHDFISALPNGYDTPLMRIFEDDGLELSVGQWQKLSVARAFYSDSDILILDEPTASLDPLAEQEIWRQFDDLRTDKTTIFVSHRLSSAVSATKIVVLEHGQVLEEGSHTELMAQNGRYKELFTVQAEKYLQSAEGV